MGTPGGGGARGEKGSLDNVANFFAGRGAQAGGRLWRPKMDGAGADGIDRAEAGGAGAAPEVWGGRSVFRREGDGEDAKITVQFQLHGVKKLVEKFAQLERL